jgi:hypothetical protein
MRWTAVKLTFAVFALALMNATAAAQIRIPRIPRPRPNQPAQTPQTPQTPGPAPQNPDALPPSAAGQGARRRQQVGAQAEAGALASAGNYLDDGFTWFEAVSSQTTDNGSRVDLGWALKSSVRLLGDYPKSSAFKFVVSKNGKPIATTRCDADFTRAEIGHSDAVSAWTDGCVKKETATKETGRFDVQVIFVNGDTDAETVVRNYKIEVLKADRVTGPTAKPVADTPQYYVSRHAEAPVSFLFFRPAKSHSYNGYGERSAILDHNTVELYFSLSPSKEGQDMRGSYVRCTVDGRPLEMQNDKVDDTAERQYAQVYTDRLAPQFKTGTEYRDEVGFSWLRLDLPFTYGAGAADGWKTNVSNHPGRWECALTNNGATWRTWRWTIGPDGMATKHPEQGGNVNLYPNSYLVETEIPAGGAAIDKRLAPVSATEGFFYGQPWTTPEGKAMASHVPAKGSPVPVASNRIK